MCCRYRHNVRAPVTLPEGVLTDDLNKLLNDDSISIGVEMIGGTKTAKNVQIKMLEAGKDVVTANKALLAEHGSELYRTARRNGRCIAFEASCAGGIPIISAIRTGLTANKITAMYGIVNGTCNYILSNMTSKDEEFGEVLARRSRKGTPRRIRRWILAAGTAPTSSSSWLLSPSDTKSRSTISPSRGSREFQKTTSAMAPRWAIVSSCWLSVQRRAGQNFTARASFFYCPGQRPGPRGRAVQCHQHIRQRRRTAHVLWPGGWNDARGQRRRGRYYRRRSG